MVSNWARNITFRADLLREPSSVPELQQVVAAAAQVRALGTGHSFNRIADTGGELVSVRQLPRLIEIDPERPAVRVGAGTRYGELGAALQAAGLALPNTGSLPHISVAGACATGTHGSGVTNPALARGVSALTMVVADGRLVTVDRTSTGEAFDGHVLALGRLGIVTELVLDVVPTFDVAQTVVEGVADDTVGDQLGAILAAAYSVSVFTTYAPDQHRVWLKHRVGDPVRWPGDRPWGGDPADGPRHPVPGVDAASATQQLGVPGPWNERLPHFRLDFVPSSGEELQSEYLLPMAHGRAAWEALLGIRELLRTRLLVGEVRTVAADAMWLGTTGGQDSIAFHFTWRPGLDDVLPVVRAVEDRLMPLGARPHWGKVFATTDAELAALYPRMAEFRDLATGYDPTGKLGNDLVDGWLGLPPR